MSAYQGRVHLATEGTLTRCSKPAGNLTTTVEWREVTCYQCLGIYNTNNRAPDNGLGKLHCRICNRPYRDHPVSASCVGLS